MKKAAEVMTDSAFSPGFKQKNGKAYDQYFKIKQQQKADSVLALWLGLEKAGAPDLANWQLRSSLSPVRTTRFSRPTWLKQRRHLFPIPNWQFCQPVKHRLLKRRNNLIQPLWISLKR